MESAEPPTWLPARLSMLLLMILQILLCLLGIWLAKRVGGPPLSARDAWAGDDDEDTATRRA